MKHDACWDWYPPASHRWLHQCETIMIDWKLYKLGPSYLGLTRSISWLLMPWLLTSPGYQQPWYWLYRMCRSFSYLRKDFKYCTCVKSMWRNDIKCKYMFMFPLKNLACKGLTMHAHAAHLCMFESGKSMEWMTGALNAKALQSVQELLNVYTIGMTGQRYPMDSNYCTWVGWGVVGGWILRQCFTPGLMLQWHNNDQDIMWWLLQLELFPWRPSWLFSSDIAELVQ